MIGGKKAVERFTFHLRETKKKPGGVSFIFVCVLLGILPLIFSYLYIFDI